MDSAGIRAVIFDLDTAVIDSRKAWQYALEEAVVTVSGERVDAGRLLEAYHGRPWSHVVQIVVGERQLQQQCTAVCEQYYRRSALKRLLVFEGIGMALDQVRNLGVEMGGITREAHANAMRQIESTGVDRFLSVLSPTNDGRWTPEERYAECLAYLERTSEQAIFVTASTADAQRVAERGGTAIRVSWAAPSDEKGDLQHPSQLPGVLRPPQGRI